MLRYADQATNDLERALDRLKIMSDMYAGQPMPKGDMDDGQPTDDATDYSGAHGKYQQYVDLVAAQVMGAMEDLVKFRKNYM